MLIDTYMPAPDAREYHEIAIASAPQDVYDALWQVDLGEAWLLKALLGLRALPSRLLRPNQPPPPTKMTLQTLLQVGFGVLETQKGEAVVLGVTGQFWKPTGNILPFDAATFEGPVPAGMARAVWDFVVHPIANGHTRLSTETRIQCGDASSRRKFLAYWRIVRPFSGLIRIIMLRAVRKACLSAKAPHS